MHSCHMRGNFPWCGESYKKVCKLWQNKIIKPISLKSGVTYKLLFYGNFCFFIHVSGKTVAKI